MCRPPPPGSLEASIRQDLKLWKQPVRTWSYFGGALRPYVRHSVWLPVIGALTMQNQVAKYCAWWLSCGVLSTIGLGTGLQTGALFLFPHIARLAADWTRCGSGAFTTQFDDVWFKHVSACHVEERRELRDLLLRAALPGFFSGLGSALGECVPFALARAMVAHGKDPVDAFMPGLSSSSQEEEPRRSYTPKILMASTRRAIQDQLRTQTFWKIFVLAAVPNALFDLCGLVCGGMEISFMTFFSAVFIAKALVRTPAQTMTIALLLGWAQQNTDPMIHRLAALLTTPPPKQGFNPLKFLWSLFTVGLFLLFATSLIEQIAQQHALSQLHHRPSSSK